MKHSTRRNYRIKKRKVASSTIFYGGYGGVSYQGTPALDGVSAYPYNDKMVDPNTPSFIENARNLPNMSSTGGSRRKKRTAKRRKNKKSKKTVQFRKKMMGGDPLSNSNSLDGPMTTQGAFQGANIIAGNNIPNTAAYSQPIQQMYNKYNSPLV
jgi:hypothetical protein